jgi:hypothetical protein
MQSIWTYATVGTVCAAALLGGLVDLNVLDDQLRGVESLDICIGFGVLEESEEVLGRLHGPASPGDTESFACIAKQSALWSLNLPDVSCFVQH